MTNNCHLSVQQTHFSELALTVLSATGFPTRQVAPTVGIQKPAAIKDLTEAHPVISLDSPVPEATPRTDCRHPKMASTQPTPFWQVGFEIRAWRQGRRDWQLPSTASRCACDTMTNMPAKLNSIEARWSSAYDAAELWIDGRSVIDLYKGPGPEHPDGVSPFFPAMAQYMGAGLAPGLP